MTVSKVREGNRKISSRYNTLAIAGEERSQGQSQNSEHTDGVMRGEQGRHDNSLGQRRDEIGSCKHQTEVSLFTVKVQHFGHIDVTGSKQNTKRFMALEPLNREAGLILHFLGMFSTQHGSLSKMIFKTGYYPVLNPQSL